MTPLTGEPAKPCGGGEGTRRSIVLHTGKPTAQLRRE